MPSSADRSRTKVASTSAGLPAPWRVPLLLLGFVCLIVGVGAGLARLGWTMPEVSVSAATMHGPLMICGFFGVVIALERAVAIGRSWAYLGPLLAGLGGMCVLAGADSAAAAFFLAASLVLVAATLDVMRRQSALFTFTLVVGAACLVVGNALWLAGWSLREAVPWWLAFPILTIAGERLELSRFLPPSRAARSVFSALLLTIVIGLIASRTRWGAIVFAAGMFGLAAWLLKQDIARRTVRGRGLTRFIAVCLLAGYLWLAVGSAVIIGARGLVAGSASYDAALHALALGFVFSMVFGHAPIIFPAVLRVAVPYHPRFYLPLIMLHASLILRIAGDASGEFALVRYGGMFGAVALLAFIASTASAVIHGKRTGLRPPPA